MVGITEKMIKLKSVVYGDKVSNCIQLTHISNWEVAFKAVNK